MSDYAITDFKVGQRVELHPAHDAWMAGDRYGTVEKVGRSILWIRSDSGRRRWLHPESIGQIVEN